MRRKVKTSKAYTIRLQQKQAEAVDELVEQQGQSANKVMDALVMAAIMALNGNAVGVQAIQTSMEAQKNLHAVERKRINEIREARRKADVARVAAFRRDQPREPMALRAIRPRPARQPKPEGKKPDSK